MQFNEYTSTLVEMFNNGPRWHVTGELVFVNPYGTGRKHVRNVNEIVHAYNGRQAVFKAAVEIAARNKYVYSEYIPSDSNIVVTRLEDIVMPEPRLPYKDN